MRGEGAGVEETPGALAGIRIAIVEEDPLLRESLAVFLKLRGCRVETFESAVEAGDSVLRDRFEIVISGFLLAGEDGISFLRKVREASKTVVTALFTGYRDNDFPEELRRSGIDGYIPKPFTAEELENTLIRLIGKGRSGNRTVSEVVA